MQKTIKNQDVNINKPIDPTLRAMELYDKEYFVMRKMRCVRSSATYLKRAFGLSFKTKQLNDEGLIEVTRIA
jgi:hypothetical protein